MVFTRTSAHLLRMLIGAVALAVTFSVGGAKASAATHYPKQAPISHVLPAASGSFGCVPLSTGAKDDYFTCQYSGPDNATMTFYLFVPQHYDATKSYPLTLILHGSGERSIASQSAAQNRAALLDNEYVAVWGPGSPAGGPSVQDTYPSFVLVPQIPLADSWVGATLADGSYALPPQPTPDLAMAMIIVQLGQQRYAGIDANRRYITGISMGAFGAWEAIERWPGYFAAAVPVAGAGSPTLASELTDTPVWAFHGAADSSVPPSGSKDMVVAIRATGGYACYTQYPNAQHAIWNTVYGLSEIPKNPLYAWLFSQDQSTTRSSSLPC